VPCGNKALAKKNGCDFKGLIDFIFLENPIVFFLQKIKVHEQV
jgi:hypothetical protein